MQTIFFFWLNIQHSNAFQLLISVSSSEPSAIHIGPVHTFGKKCVNWVNITLIIAVFEKL